MALGILTGLVSGASKLLGGKKKSGAKMGSAIVKRDPNQGAVEKKQTDIKVKTKVVSVASLLNTKSLEPASKEQSKKSSGVDSIDSALDRIDSTLAGIIATVEDRSNIQRNAIRKKNIRNERAKKSAREDQLESKKPHKFGMKIPRPFKSAFGAIQDFFSNIIIGGLVLFVLNNIDTVMDTLKNVYKTMKNVITKIGDFLKPVWRAMKWMVEGFSPSGLDLVNGILANKNTQDLMDLDKMKGLVDESTRFAKEISEIETESRKFGSEFKNIQQQFLSSSNEVETSMNDISPPPPLPQEQYTIPTLVPLIKSVGATDDEAVRLAAIGMHESSGNPNARNTTYPDNSYGLFQVNMLDEPGYRLGEERRQKYNITNNDLLNPQTNARVALDIMRTQGRSAWSTDSMVTPAQLDLGKEALKLGRESLKSKSSSLQMGDQSSIVNTMNQVASLMTTPSYGTGNTIVLMGGNEQPSVQQSGGASGPVLIAGPSKKEVLNSFYESRFKSSLYKVG